MEGPAEPTEISPARRRLVRALATTVAAIASFLTMYALCGAYDAQAAPAVLAAILAITLSRRGDRARHANPATSVLAFASMPLIATGAASLLHVRPILGAVVFTAAMFCAIWLRNFGRRASSLGAMLATPLVALLVVPGRPAAPGGPLVDLGLLISAGIVAFAYVTGVESLARRAGFAAAGTGDATSEPGERKRRAGLSVPTRMALQMAVALGAAFAAGFAFFPGHFGWTVLTAFIVCSGARGRGDAAYKGILRLGGALVGTAAAAALAHLWAPAGITEASLIFTILFFGLYLREINYAYWAACMTLILALLSRSSDGSTIALLGVRLEAISTGAVCAVAAAWFVYPIRTEAVIRRRLAGALVALDDVVTRAHLSEAERVATLALFERRMADLDQVATPVRWHKRIFGSANAPEHPGRWVELAFGLREHARGYVTYADRERRGGAVRRAIGVSRRAIANHGKADVEQTAPPVSVALDNLRDALTLAQTRKP